MGCLTQRRRSGGGAPRTSKWFLSLDHWQFLRTNREKRDPIFDRHVVEVSRGATSLHANVLSMWNDDYKGRSTLHTGQIVYKFSANLGQALMRYFISMTTPMNMMNRKSPCQLKHIVGVTTKSGILGTTFTSVCLIRERLEVSRERGKNKFVL